MLQGECGRASQRLLRIEHPHDVGLDVKVSEVVRMRPNLQRIDIRVIALPVEAVCVIDQDHMALSERMLRNMSEFALDGGLKFALCGNSRGIVAIEPEQTRFLDPWEQLAQDLATVPQKDCDFRALAEAPGGSPVQLLPQFDRIYLLETILHRVNHVT